jgi:hypothetical protein
MTILLDHMGLLLVDFNWLPTVAQFYGAAVTLVTPAYSHVANTNVATLLQR